MYNIYDAFESFKFERIMNHDFLQVEECIKNFNVYEDRAIMEGYLDDLLNFENVTEGVKEIKNGVKSGVDKVIKFIKECWRRIKEWFGKVIGHFKKQKSAKEECAKKIKEANVKAEGGSEPEAELNRKVDRQDGDNRSAKEIYKEKSSKNRAAARLCHSPEEVLHNSNLEMELPYFVVENKKLTDLPGIVKEGLEDIQDSTEKVISSEMEPEEYDALVRDFANGPLSKKDFKEGEKASNKKVLIKNHVDAIMAVLNDAQDVIGVLNKMQKDNDNIMQGYINMCKSINTDDFNALGAKIQKALNCTTQFLKGSVGQIGRGLGLCNGALKKATAEYVARINS